MTPTLPCNSLALQGSFPQDPGEETTNISIIFLLGEDSTPPQGDIPALGCMGAKGEQHQERCTRWELCNNLNCITLFLHSD